MAAKSSKGQTFIQNQLATQKRWFKTNLDHLRKHLKTYNDEELWKQHIVSGEVDCVEMRHRAYQVGQYKGAYIYLYDDDGEGIQEPTHLQDALDKWTCLGKHWTNSYSGLTVYVVSANTH